MELTATLNSQLTGHHGAARRGAASDQAAEPASADMWRNLRILSYFMLWYVLNIGYNIYNKQALNALPLPWTFGLIQMFAGIPYVALLWATGLRTPPKVSFDNVVTLTPSAVCHLGTHIGAVLSLGAGAVSFTHIVKASEPVVSAAMCAVFLGQIMHPVVYLSLVPVIGGVGLASLEELSFTMFAFATAMLSNVSSAGRGVLSKGLMGKSIGENLNAPNLFGVLTIIAFVIMIPVSLFFEPPSVISAAIEVAPVTHAVGNTIKRVVIILASVIVFKNPLTPLGALGSIVAILGTLLYSIAQQKFK